MNSIQQIDDQAAAVNRRDLQTMDHNFPTMMSPAKRLPTKRPTLTLRGPVSQPEPEPVAVEQPVVETAEQNVKPGLKPGHPVVMPHAEFREILKELKCSSMTVAYFFGANDRTSRRWWSGQSLLPPAVACLVRCAVLVARDRPYREIAAQMERESKLLLDWEQTVLAREAAKAAKAAKKKPT